MSESCVVQVNKQELEDREGRGRCKTSRGGSRPGNPACNIKPFLNQALKTLKALSYRSKLSSGIGRAKPSVTQYVYCLVLHMPEVHHS